MKTGVILYVTGGGDAQADLDIKEAVRRLDIKADRIETVLGSSTCFDVMDAWWKFTAKGMKMIICMLAEVTSNGELHLTGRELRLFG